MERNSSQGKQISGRYSPIVETRRIISLVVVRPLVSRKDAGLQDQELLAQEADLPREGRPRGGLPFCGQMRMRETLEELRTHRSPCQFARAARGRPVNRRIDLEKQQEDRQTNIRE